jgi:hypothetical protein
MRNIVLLVFSVFSLASLPACTASILQNELFEAEEFNLTQSSYAAADMLIQQSKSFVNSDTPLQIGMLTDIQNPQRHTAFGRLVTSHIGARFVQLGYNVTTASFAPMPTAHATRDPNELFVSDMSGPGQPYGIISQGSGSGGQKAIITGNYALARNHILVNLRVIEEGTGRLLAAYDYNLPHSRDLKTLTSSGDDKESTLFGF